LTYSLGRHRYAFGVDTRRTELNSELPRNARPLITFNGAPEIDITPAGTLAYSNRFIRPETFAATSAASGFSQTLATGGESAINLRFYQFDFFAQDEWRISDRVSLSYGLRYEYNTPPREVNRRIENTFNDPSLSIIPGLRQFLALGLGQVVQLPQLRCRLRIDGVAPVERLQRFIDLPQRLVVGLEVLLAAGEQVAPLRGLSVQDALGQSLDFQARRLRRVQGVERVDRLLV